jgi:hypothetical protein
METIRIDSHFTAFIRPVEGVNAGMIHPGGMILINTTSSSAKQEVY